MAFLPTAALPQSRRGGGGAGTRARTRVAPRRIGMVAAPPSPSKVLTRETQTVKKAQKPKQYRLYIINDPVNTKQRVVSVLLKVVQGLTFSRAQVRW